ncbi:MAG: response regulator [Thermodesulfovibrionales bacterium]|nr:response regulator [Thermodesulfovibrionales bacterium]
MVRRVYVVDDVPTNIELVEAVFKSNKDIVIMKANNGKELLELIDKEGVPDLLILDLMMPVMDGFEVLKNIKNIRESKYFPIIVLSALTDKQSIIQALSHGADDYITKPFFVEELKARVNNMLKLKERDEFLSATLDVMESNLFEKLKMLEQSQLEVIIRLGKAAEFRDDETGKHIERISDYIHVLGETMGLHKDYITMLRYAAPMHDVGKIGIPDNILLKPGKLTEDEFRIIQLHTVIGGKILGGTTLPMMELATEIALSHHEKWDGSGYPLKLSKNSIPQSGRLVAIIDVFDALTSHRVYKQAWSIESAFDFIKEQREKMFDPDVVDAFFECSEKIINIKTTKTDDQHIKPIIQQIIDGDVTIEEFIERSR